MGRVVKALRRSNSLSRSIFSTAGSFGMFMGKILCLFFPEKSYGPRRSEFFFEKCPPAGTGTKIFLSREDFFVFERFPFSSRDFRFRGSVG